MILTLNKTKMKILQYKVENMMATIIFIIIIIPCCNAYMYQCIKLVVSIKVIFFACNKVEKMKL